MDILHNLEEIYQELNDLNKNLNEYIDLVDSSMYNPKTSAKLDKMRDTNTHSINSIKEKILDKIEILKKEEKDDIIKKEKDCKEE